MAAVKRKPHPVHPPHPEHSGEYFSWTENPVNHYHTHNQLTHDALTLILRTLRGLDSNGDREGILSLVLSTLVHEDKLGLMRIYAMSRERINHFLADKEGRRY